MYIKEISCHSKHDICAADAFDGHWRGTGASVFGQHRGGLRPSLAARNVVPTCESSEQIWLASNVMVYIAVLSLKPKLLACDIL